MGTSKDQSITILLSHRTQSISWPNYHQAKQSCGKKKTKQNSIIPCSKNNFESKITLQLHAMLSKILITLHAMLNAHNPQVKFF